MTRIELIEIEKVSIPFAPTATLEMSRKREEPRRPARDLCDVMRRPRPTDDPHRTHRDREGQHSVRANGHSRDEPKARRAAATGTRSMRRHAPATTNR